jgi:hypothetical protein
VVGVLGRFPQQDAGGVGELPRGVVVLVVGGHAGGGGLGGEPLGQLGEELGIRYAAVAR